MLYIIISAVVGAIFWYMLVWLLIEENNIKAKIDISLFFGGALALAILDLHAGAHTTAFFSALFFTAVAVRAVVYLSFELSRDIVASAQSAWTAVKTHPLASIALIFATYSVIDSAKIVLG